MAHGMQGEGDWGGDGSSEAPVFRRDQAMEMVAHDEELLRTLLSMFQEQGQQRLQTIQEAVVSDDHDALRSAAHSLRGSAGSLALVRISHLAHELEKAGAQERASTADELATALASAMDETLAELRRQELLT